MYVIKHVGLLVTMVLGFMHTLVAWPESTVQLCLCTPWPHFWVSRVICALASTSAITWVKKARILLTIPPLGCTLSWANYVRDRKLEQVSGHMKLIQGCKCLKKGTYFCPTFLRKSGWIWDKIWVSVKMNLYWLNVDSKHWLLYYLNFNKFDWFC